MAQTKQNLIDAVRLILSGGYPSINDRVQDPEIELALHDAMNAVMRAAVFEINYSFDGGAIPDGAIITPYFAVPTRPVAPTRIPTNPGPNPPAPPPIAAIGGNNQGPASGRLTTPVITLASSCFFDLPAYPMQLPEGAGVWSITDSTNPATQYLPVPAGYTRMLGGSFAFSPMIAGGVYERRGNRVYITAPTMPMHVDVELCICDFISAGPTDIIPASPEQIDDIKRRALQMLGVTVAPARDKDRGQGEQQNPEQQA